MAASKVICVLCIAFMAIILPLLSGCCRDSGGSVIPANNHWATFAVYRTYYLWHVELPVDVRDVVPGTNLVVFPEGPWCLVLSVVPGQMAGWAAKFEDLEACVKKAGVDSGVSFSQKSDRETLATVGVFNEVGTAGHYYHLYRNGGACVFLETVDQIDPALIRKTADWVSSH